MDQTTENLPNNAQPESTRANADQGEPSPTRFAPKNTKSCATTDHSKPKYRGIAPQRPRPPTQKNVKTNPAVVRMLQEQQ